MADTKPWKDEEVIYEDELVAAALISKGAAEGHVKVFPKEALSDLEQASDDLVTHLFYVASYAATAVFEYLQAQGTNIIVQNGKDQFTPEPYLSVDVIPRRQDDGLNFMWEPKRLEEGEMNDVQNAIKDKTFMIGKKQETEEKTVIVEDDQGSEEALDARSQDNYLLKQIRRIP